ncbi:MAG: hypothetical protein K0B85_05115 [Coriobacteriia bacterium]|nr:hypothetical protein [Coriobacteriia bacterium]
MKKRTLIVVALAVTFVLALSATAFAGAFHNTEQGRNASEYVAWDGPNAVKGTVNPSSPHKGYEQTTTKCAVCHSVHFAYLGTDNERDPAGARDAELLLRGTVGMSCSYCHIQTSIGVKEVYGGVQANYGTEQNDDSGYAHNWHATGCNVCHAVHGANTYDGALTTKILQAQPRGRSPQPLVTAGSAAGGIFDSAEQALTYEGDRFLQQVAFCASCHYQYSDDSYRAIQTRNSLNETKQHPMVMASESLAAQGASYKGKVAWQDSTTCRSCHSAGVYDETPGLTGYSINNFPHYTAGAYRFLTQEVTAEYASDQVCLDCHRSADGELGVGIDF